MKHVLILLGVILLLAVGALFFYSQGVTETGQLGDLQQFEGTTFETFDGETVALSEYAGKPLIINSWAVWCPFCREELPDFVQLQEEFDDEVIVIAINRQESLGKARGYTDELGITDDMVYLLDPGDEFYKGIGGFSMPETIFVDETGTIVVHKRGFMDLNEMREHTNTIITNATTQ